MTKYSLIDSKKIMSLILRIIHEGETNQQNITQEDETRSAISQQISFLEENSIIKKERIGRESVIKINWLEFLKLFNELIKKEFELLKETISKLEQININIALNELTNEIKIKEFFKKQSDPYFTIATETLSDLARYYVYQKIIVLSFNKKGIK